MIILGLETSCDDTGIAILEIDRKKSRILSNVVSSQVQIHSPYGGVVPNLAARAHLENIEPCLKKALREARLHRYARQKRRIHCELAKHCGQAGNPKIDLIAVTIGPGLIPCLLVGVNFAKALSYANRVPLIGINHIEGHIMAQSLTDNNPVSNFKKALPALCLIVSGGHTELVLAEKIGQYKILGQTRDDAAGEAFDKTAKLLGLGYPGGPLISKRAKQGNPAAFDLPRPMLREKNFDFSFSGLKTAVLYAVKKEKKLSPKYIDDMSASFEQAAIDVLKGKTIKAALQYKPKTVILAGGVAANSKLRRELQEAILKHCPACRFQTPELKFCTDNGAMIAQAAYFRQKEAKKDNWKKILANANLKL